MDTPTPRDVAGTPTTTLPVHLKASNDTAVKASAPPERRIHAPGIYDIVWVWGRTGPAGGTVSRDRNGSWRHGESGLCLTRQSGHFYDDVISITPHARDFDLRERVSGDGSRDYA